MCPGSLEWALAPALTWVEGLCLDQQVPLIWDLIGLNGTIYSDLMDLIGFYSDSYWDFIVIQWDIHGIYPLVICYIAIENGHRNS